MLSRSETSLISFSVRGFGVHGMFGDHAELHLRLHPPERNSHHVDCSVAAYVRA